MFARIATAKLASLCLLSILASPGMVARAEQQSAAPTDSMDIRRETEQRANAADLQGKQAFIRVLASGSWLGESIKGKGVVTVDGETAGAVSDIVIGPDGVVQGLVLNRGGVLGVGATMVAIDVAFFELLPGASQAKADLISQTHPETAPAPKALDANGSRQSGEGSAAGAIKLGPDGLPEHLVVRLSLKELDGAPMLEGR